MTESRLKAKQKQQRFALSKQVEGNPFKVGGAFNALGFRHTDFDVGFDPLIMVDHYTMTAPTFGPHPHAGLSAVSIIFEDSTGLFHNRDSLGNDFDIAPGDVYWLKAGSGAYHDEEPRKGAKIHGLQVFVNIPNTQKNDSPESLHIKAEDIPIIKKQDKRIRVLLGSLNGVESHKSPSVPLTILDGNLKTGGHFELALDEGESAWIYAVSGSTQLSIGADTQELYTGNAIALVSGEEGLSFHLSNTRQKAAHFVVFKGKSIDETFYQHGPLIAADYQSMGEVTQRLSRGLFGTIPEKN